MQISDMWVVPLEKLIYMLARYVAPAVLRTVFNPVVVFPEKSEFAFNWDRSPMISQWLFCIQK